MIRCFSILLFSMFVVTLAAQNESVTGKYYGIVQNDSVKIEITFNIKPDSTYEITMTGDSICSTITTTDSGSWRSEEGWIYFQPGYGSDFYCRNAHGHDSKKRKSKMQDEDYNEGLKITRSKDHPDRIYFYVSFDCVEMYWDDHYVEKVK